MPKNSRTLDVSRLPDLRPLSLLSTADVARILDCSTSKVLELVYAGLLKPVRDGAKPYRFTRAGVALCVARRLMENVRGPRR